ncbi:MAG: acetyl-CoA carboxylase, biotin carboxyl carrier protein [Bdellovibrionaceae bacterium]|nr:acetyl-CoA carboxylase, biotin carboxyl carrier protein [Pseudobdellovibrionaceae bacterium]
MIFDFEEIQQLIDLMKSNGVYKIKWEGKNDKLTVKMNHAGTMVIPSPAIQAAPVAPASVQESSVPLESDRLKVIKSPFVGTFYSAPSPDQADYVSVGKNVSKGEVLCIVEAMKLMNELESDYSGKIVEVLVENEQPVEYDEPLFVIEV